jgi:hypothetical protein
MPAASGACNVVDTQSAISGHWSQSTGADLSGQHGISSDMDAASSAIEAMAIDAVESAFARAVSGANTRPAIKKTASSRQRWIDRFTRPVSHNPAYDGKPSSITKPRVSLTLSDWGAPQLRWINRPDPGAPSFISCRRPEHFRWLRLEIAAAFVCGRSSSKESRHARPRNDRHSPGRPRPD